MYVSAELMAAQVAMLHLMMKEKPELRLELTLLAGFYEENFFVPNGDVLECTRSALDHMLEAVDRESEKG